MKKGVGDRRVKGGNGWFMKRRRMGWVELGWTGQDDDGCERLGGRALG